MADLLLKMPNTYEPLRKNRFVFRFPSDLGIQSWTVESGKRPSLNQNATEIQFLNTSTWVLGRYTWQEMQLTFRDPIGPSTSQALMEWVRLGSESVTGRQGYAVAYKRDLILEMCDPTGTSISQWIIKEAMITSAKFSELDYSGDDLATIDLTIKPYYCILSY